MTSTAAALAWTGGGAALILYAVSARNFWLHRSSGRVGLFLWCVTAAVLSIAAPVTPHVSWVTPLLLSCLPLCCVRYRLHVTALLAAAGLMSSVVLFIYGAEQVGGLSNGAAWNLLAGNRMWTGALALAILCSGTATALFAQHLRHDSDVPPGPIPLLFTCGALLWLCFDLVPLFSRESLMAGRAAGTALVGGVFFVWSDRGYSSRFSQLRHSTGFEEDELERERESSRASLVSVLAASISHEIRHMLHNIGLAAAGGIAKREPDAQRASLELVEAYTERGGEAIFELLEIMRQPASLQGVTHIPVEMHGLFSIAERLARRRDTDMIVDFGGGGSVAMSKALLWEVVLNLVLNALDAVSRLPERWVRVAWEWTTESVTLVVVDSGPGVGIERAAAVFEAGESGGEGTGLGLHIARQIVERAGGDIRYQPREGRSAFRATFPRIVAGGGRL